MRKSNHHALRKLLREYADGLSVPEIAEKIEQHADSIRASLQSMPDAYIDRWQTRRGKYLSAVWCVVAVPEHCPKPERREK